ncbi:unnamed protein product [Effrenium voratum]|uniref:Uncharacterized protein n=1 Tax=Effrenium voratum TaxID=2562239 RepID=A0AA36MUS5_9DINO|nr:unnamed protein product [Effrenium voratum]CAJ1433848.1 unnamed protein product [Effrenium voratum]
MQWTESDALLELEMLLPQSLRSSMLPLELENAHLLVGLLQSRLSARLLQANCQLLQPGNVANGHTEVADETDAHISSDALALTAAEVVALLVSLRVRRGFEAEAHAGFCNELATAEEQLCQLWEEHMEQDVRGKQGYLFGISSKAQADQLQVKSLEKRCWQQVLNHYHHSLQERELELAECCAELSAEEHALDQLRGSGAGHTAGIDAELRSVRQLETLARRLERGEAEMEAECSRRSRRSLTQAAWRLSHELEEETLRADAHLLQLETREKAEGEEGEEREREIDVRWQRAREELAEQAPRQGEVAEVLSEALQLRKELGAAGSKRAAEQRAESEALRQLRLSSKRNASVRESLKHEVNSLADLKEKQRELEARERALLVAQRQAWQAEQVQAEEDSQNGIQALGDALRAETFAAKQEAEVARSLRVELRSMRAKQQHCLRQSRHIEPDTERGGLHNFELDVQKRMKRREQQLQQLRSSLALEDSRSYPRNSQSSESSYLERTSQSMKRAAAPLLAVLA